MNARPVSEVMEDLEFLDDARVGAAEAARRLDFPTAHALGKWLERHDNYALWLRLKKRDPEGLHTKENRMAAVPTTDPIGALLTRAHASGKRIKNKALKIETLVADLRDALAADEEAAKARNEVARLERQLAEAKARLRGGTTPTATTGDSKAIRAWAAENGIACPSMGRVPSAVRDAYTAATSSDAA